MFIGTTPLFMLHDEALWQFHVRGLRVHSRSLPAGVPSTNSRAQRPDASIYTTSGPKRGRASTCEIQSTITPVFVLLILSVAHLHSPNHLPGCPTMTTPPSCVPSEPAALKSWRDSSSAINPHRVILRSDSAPLNLPRLPSSPSPTNRSAGHRYRGLPLAWLAKRVHPRQHPWS